MILSENVIKEVKDESVIGSIKRLEDIEIDSNNNEGQNGYVFFGYHKVFEKRVAVKYYYYGENAHEEVTLIKTINDMNLQKIWDAHTVGEGWAYFITDQQEQGTLADAIESGISTHQAIHLIRGVIAGVAALHSKPNYIVHRDLKPENILVDAKGNAIIADFGSVKRIHPDEISTVSSAGHTPLYRPPETFESRKYGYTSDIYQIGIILYQLLGGKLSISAMDYMTKLERKKYLQINDPFERCAFENECIFNKANAGRLLNYSSMPDYIDRKLIKLIKKATKPNPEDRFQTAAEMRAKLYEIGSLPNWKDENEKLFCTNGNDEYRIITNAKNKYCIEKQNNSLEWRKARGSSIYKTRKEAIESLITML